MEATLGAIVKDARLYRVLTQKQLAAKLGVTQQIISSIEADRNTPNVYTLIQIGKALGLTLCLSYR